MEKRICSSLKKVLSENVRILRKKRNLTQEQLAEKIGVATMTISRIERGKEWASDSILESLAEFFDLPYVYLFFNSADDFKDLMFVSLDSFKDLMLDDFKKKMGDSFKIIPTDQRKLIK